MDAVARYLSRCAFQGVEFPSTSVKTSWGYDYARHAPLGFDGARAQNTGKKAKEIEVTAAFLTRIKGWPTNLWPDRYFELLDALEANGQGEFVHPTRGLMTVQVGVIDEPIEAAKPRNGAYVTFRLLEINEVAGLLGGTAPADAATQAEVAADRADTAGAALPAPPPALSPALEQTLTFLEGGARSFRETVSSLDALDRTIAQAITWPSAQGIEGHEYRSAVETLRDAVNRYRDMYLGTEQVRLYVVPTTMSLARIASLPAVYGDASKARMLRDANRIPDESFVRAGTALVVPAA